MAIWLGLVDVTAIMRRPRGQAGGRYAVPTVPAKARQSKRSRPYLIDADERAQSLALDASPGSTWFPPATGPADVRPVGAIPEVDWYYGMSASARLTAAIEHLLSLRQSLREALAAYDDAEMPLNTSDLRSGEVFAERGDSLATAIDEWGPEIERALTEPLEPELVDNPSRQRTDLLAGLVLAAEVRTLRRVVRALAKRSLGDVLETAEELALGAPKWTELGTRVLAKAHPVDAKALAGLQELDDASAVSIFLGRIRSARARECLRRNSVVKLEDLYAAIGLLESPSRVDWRETELGKLGIQRSAGSPKWSYLAALLDGLTGTRTAGRTQEIEWYQALTRRRAGGRAQS